MKRTQFHYTILILPFLIFSCAKSSESPVLPGTDLVPRTQSTISGAHLWGMWDINIDPVAETIEATPLRGVAFTANVTKLLDSVPSTLHFEDLGIEFDTGIVELDVGIKHPIPSFNQFTGFDVIGVFLGHGPGVYLNAAGVPEISDGTTMLKNADGYTRWFNAPEFTGAGQEKPIFGYYPGKLGTPGCEPGAILNPYKFFTDGLDPDASAYDYLIEHPDMRGSFAPGSINYRHYSLVFPNISTEGLRFQYAIVAHWAPNLNHPAPPDSFDDWPPGANSGEALVAKIEDASTAFYEDSTSYGGNVVLKISALDWSADCEDIQEEYEIWCHSDAWDGPFLIDMSCSGEAWNGSAFVADIPVTNLQSADPISVWIEIRYPMVPYASNSGVPNEAKSWVATYLYHELWLKMTTPAPCSNGWAESWGFVGIDRALGVANDKSNNVFIAGDSWVPLAGPDITIAKYGRCGDLKWGYTWGSAATDYANDVAVDSVGNVYIVGMYATTMDMNPGVGSDLRDGMCDAFVIKFSNTGSYLWGLTFGVDSNFDEALGIAVQDSGWVYICGYFNGKVDLDPGPGEDFHNAGNGSDGYLSKFDSSGSFEWARTWGGGGPEVYCGGIATTASGEVYVVGGYSGYSLDFDPGPGFDYHFSEGWDDAFLSKFDSSGNYIWAKTWGGEDNDSANSVAIDGSGYIYLTGGFMGTVDMDPNFDTDLLTALGYRDGYLSKFDAAGNQIWSQSWGDPSPFNGTTTARGVAVDSTGNCYVTGDFIGTSLSFSQMGGDIYQSNGGRDLYFSKWGPSGNFLWARHIGGTGNDIGYDMSVDSQGNPYGCGSYEMLVNFAPVGPPCNDGYDYHNTNWEDDIFVTMMLPDGCW